MLIQIRDLSYTYSPGTPLAHTALRAIDLDIEPGERIALLGPTGSGKSTLAQAVAGLLAPTSGQVLLDGVAAHGRGTDARSRRLRVGMAFQYPEHQIFEQTVFDEVAYGARRLGATGGELEHRVVWALGLVGMEPDRYRERNPLALSGGEMRRVALAGILVRHPDVLLLDEPTANLDPKGRQLVLAGLVAWQAETAATIITVSHRLDDLAQISDRAVLLAGGEIAADQPSRQLLSDPGLLAQPGFPVPATVALLRLLRHHGWRVQVDRLLPSEAAAEIASALRTRQAAA